MPKKKSAMRKEANIKIGDISDVSGTVNVAGGDITTHHTATGLSTAEIKQLFDGLYTTIETRSETPTADKEDLKSEVEEIQTIVKEAAQKNEKVDESFLSRRFRNIARMAPDVLEVVVKTLANPALGIGDVVKKIALKAKKEAKAS